MNGSQLTSRPLDLLGIALASSATLIFEIALLRIFSFVIWHHFAFMVISVALLGFALSGVIVSRRPSIAMRAKENAASAAMTFAITSLLAVVLIARLPLDPTRLAAEPTEFAKLLLYQALLVIPFTAAGLAVLIMLRQRPASAGRLYGADLIGAGVGALLVIPAVALAGADGTLLIAAALAFTAAAAWRSSARGRSIAAIAALVTLALVPLGSTLLPISPGPGKLLAVLLDHQRFPESRLLFSRWSPLARVDVVENAGTVEWTKNARAEQSSRAASQLMLLLDGDAVTPIVERGDGDSLQFLDSALGAAAYQWLRPEKVLVIGAGGGVDILAAKRFGAKTVDAVEINPLVAETVAQRFAARSMRPFEQPGVTLRIDEGRAFVRRSHDRYDLIQLSLIDTWAASAAGAYSLSEGYLYTVEAFGDYFDHLSDDGVLTITRWEWSPPRETLRLLTVAREALRRRGVADPSRCVALVGVGAMGNLIVRGRPFSAEELAALQRLAEQRAYRIVLPASPGTSNPFSEFMATRDPARFVADYPLEISPTTDNSPFFFQFGRWRQLDLFGTGWSESPLVLSGRLVLVAVLLQASLLSALLLVLPLRFGARSANESTIASKRARRGALLYFAAIGLGFMLLELALMQRFALFLGGPLRATAVVLATLLVTAGCGSLWADRLTLVTGRLFGAIVAVAAVLAFSLPPLFSLLLPLTLALRVIASIVILAPLGFLLGVPMARGLAQLDRSGRADLFPLAWVANGCASVVGPIVAVLLALDIGFTGVTLLAAAAYLGASRARLGE